MFTTSKAEFEAAIAQGQKEHRKRIYFGCLFAFIACVGITAGAIWMLLNDLARLVDSEPIISICATTRPDRLIATEGLGQFEFPPSAANIFTDCFGLNAWYAYARFEMLPSDLDTFIASTRINREELTTETSSSSIQSSFIQRGFADMTEYLYGFNDEPELLQEVLIDVSNPDLYIVHISMLAG